MANLLEDYIAKLTANVQPYTPLTEEQMAEKAKNRYQAVYDQNRLSAQQQYDAEKLARDQQLSALLEQYQLQREQSAKNYQETAASAVRGALNRGMQRSSYIGATVGNIGIKGAEAQQAINRNQEGSVRNATEQQELAAKQLAAQLAQYDKSQLADQLTYQDTLEEREYNRGMTAADRANQLAGDIYNAQLQAAQNNWWGMGALLGIPDSGGSSGGYSGSKGSGSGGGGNGGDKGTDYEALRKALNFATGRQEIDPKNRTPSKTTGSTVSMKF